MRTLAVFPVVLVSLSLLAGCSEASVPSEPAPSSSAPTAVESDATSDSEVPTPSGAPVEGVALAEIAMDLECSDYALAATVAPGAAEYGTCQLDGVRVQLYRFASIEDKQVFLDQVKAYGVVESQLAVTKDGLVAAAPADQRLLVRLQEGLRG
ncbi:hypothetical protein C5D34_05685 [Rathayibacter sp. AY1B1]|uniref:hypothetical protein n=1 Tax=unclassified Rathayibacter TaxID=2609250 RepID=UPI000CE78E4E|nr:MULTISPECIES: hypothetical protein [unclassified Rathayibacter]PPI24262.1 hypothetical protein C5D08_03440 [Rathayibacter sp. AY1B6]PPI36728.1 hypothetical protein C5D34_05685 [Rathayibacter sp. AY1B1]